MIIQKYLSKSQNGKLISFYNNILFIFECFTTNNTPSDVKKHREVPNKKVTR